MDTRTHRRQFFSHGVLAPGLFFFGLLVCAVGCADTDPEEPGIEKPVVAGLVTGDIRTRREYTDAVEAANKRNADRGDGRDWRYVKPAVGPAE